MKKLAMAILLLACLPAGAAEEVSAKTVVDRLQIQDLITQGKEWSTFVKVNGHWRYKTRQIKGGVEAPDGWRE